MDQGMKEEVKDAQGEKEEVEDDKEGKGSVEEQKEASEIRIRKNFARGSKRKENIFLCQKSQKLHFRFFGPSLDRASDLGRRPLPSSLEPEHIRPETLYASM